MSARETLLVEARRALEAIGLDRTAERLTASAWQIASTIRVVRCDGAHTDGHDAAIVALFRLGAALVEPEAPRGVPLTEAQREVAAEKLHVLEAVAKGTCFVAMSHSLVDCGDAGLLVLGDTPNAHGCYWQMTAAGRAALALLGAPVAEPALPVESDTVPRPPGCVCTWEQGDTACPVHPTCPECGCVVCECRAPKPAPVAWESAEAMASQTERALSAALASPDPEAACRALLAAVRGQG